MFFDLFKVDSDDSKPRLFHINHVEVEHGLVVAQDEDQPGGIEGKWVVVGGVGGMCALSSGWLRVGEVREGGSTLGCG